MHTAGLLCGVSHKTLGLGQKGLDLDFPTGQALLQVTRTHCPYTQRLSAAPLSHLGKLRSQYKVIQTGELGGNPWLWRPVLPTYPYLLDKGKQRETSYPGLGLPPSLPNTAHLPSSLVSWNPKKRYCQAEITTEDIFWCTLLVPTCPMSYQVGPLVSPSPHKARLTGC